jgi:hypothetical protein
MAFFRDRIGTHYVAVRWYSEIPRGPRSPYIDLPPLKLTPENDPASYSILPVDAIVNGALLVPYVDTFWAVLSPRQQLAYQLLL